MNISSIKETLCDNYCKYPHLCDGEEELRKHCDKCEVCAALDELEDTLNATIAGQLTLQEALIKAHDEAVKDFSHFLIDKSEDGCVRIDELPYLLMQWRKGADNESSSSGIRAEYKNGEEYFTVPEGKPEDGKSAEED